MERREALKLAIGLPLAVGSLKSLADQVARTCLILDRQFDGAIADNSQLLEKVDVVWPFDRDITALWLQKIQPFWRDRDNAVMGLTDLPTLGALRVLAASEGRKVLSSEPLVESTGAVMWVIG